MKIKLLFFIGSLFFLNACTTRDTSTAVKKDAKTTSQKSVENPQKIKDTLGIGYSHWWPHSGPFLGLCGASYYLVVTGTILELGDIRENEIFGAQTGIIAIEEKLFSQATKNQKFSSQKFIKSNCFFRTGVKVGDKVLLFNYEYDGSYANPGNKSVLKIEDFDGPEVQSIKTYIASQQNPLAIQKDLKLWEKRGLGTQLQNIIDCRLEMQKKE